MVHLIHIIFGGMQVRVRFLPFPDWSSPFYTLRLKYSVQQICASWDHILGYSVESHQ